MIEDIGCISESIILPLVTNALMIRERTMNSNANQPQADPIAIRIIGAIPDAKINVIATMVPAIEPNAFHNDFAYPARSSTNDEYM